MEEEEVMLQHEISKLVIKHFMIDKVLQSLLTHLH
jgi:hypothetical protein